MMKKIIVLALLFLMMASCVLGKKGVGGAENFIQDLPNANLPSSPLADTTVADAAGSDTTTTDWPADPPLTANSHTYVAGNGAKVVNEVGFSESGNTASVGSADSIYTSNFVFNDVTNTVFTILNRIIFK